MASASFPGQPRCPVGSDVLSAFTGPTLVRGLWDEPPSDEQPLRGLPRRCEPSAGGWYRGGGLTVSAGLLSAVHLLPWPPSSPRPPTSSL